MQRIALFHKLHNERLIKKLCKKLEQRGVRISSSDTPLLLSRTIAILFNVDLFLEREPRVQFTSAPFVPSSPVAFRQQPAWMLMGAAAALGCDGIAPLERFVEQIGFSKTRMCMQYPLQKNIQWDDGNIYTGIYREASGFRSFSQGSPEAIISHCTHILDGREREMTADDIASLRHCVALAKNEGMDLLAFATGDPETVNEDIRTDMTFLGILAFGREIESGFKNISELFHTREVAVIPVCRDRLMRCVWNEILGSEKKELIRNGRTLKVLPDDIFNEKVKTAAAFEDIESEEMLKIVSILSDCGTVLTAGFDCEGAVSVSFDGNMADIIFEDGSPDDLIQLISECKTLFIEQA